ncbi:MAG: alpha-glucan family phosphorylase [Salinivirgaceae bacterium]|nr:alpha-glucan family phosphorylase [Salinivirgaceae bacterium]
MSDLIKPAFLFETSWEVCNKVGGIHTVITSKMPNEYAAYGDNIIFIGPDLVREDGNPEFIEDKSLKPEWKEVAEKEGLRLKIGRWNVAHKPMAVLVDYTVFIPLKDKLFASWWETYKLDSITGEWEYIESVLFGYAAGKVVESYKNFYLPDSPVVAQFHEWQTGSGVLYLDRACPKVATVFTTHATVLGRSVAGNGFPLYKSLGSFDPDIRARELGVMAKHSLEKTAAQVASVYTTVSQVTANECKVLLNNEPDAVTPNGFALNHLPKMDADVAKNARKKLAEVTEALTGNKCDDETLFVAISGRYEFKNKGIDIFIDALGKLNTRSEYKHNVVGFILVPNFNYGPRKCVADRLADSNVRIPDERITTHSLNPDYYDPVMDKTNQLQLTNNQGQQVNVVLVPVYLNGNDGIFNMPYYELLSGFDLTAFPSYYEPWGYTPLESIAVGVPTVTTSMAGFGQWMQKRTSGIADGIEVLNRTEDNYWEVVDDLAGIITKVYKMPAADRQKLRQKAKEQAQEISWDNLFHYYTEAYSKALTLSLARAEDQTTHINNNFNNSQKLMSNEPIWKKMVIHSDLPERLKNLDNLANNLWWCWNYEAIEMFKYIDPELWAKVEKNPIALLKVVSTARLAELEKDTAFLAKFDRVSKTFAEYMSASPRKDMPLVGYFSMEYGLTDNLKIFSGGLGILAGDYLKEASDSNMPMVGIGFLYKYGYFTQELTVSGEQQASLVPQNMDNLPISAVLDEFKRQLTISLNLPGRMVKARIWKVQVGRIPLYLLDTEHPDNSPEDRAITQQLYGGDWENRLKQEMLLGMGGIRALKAMNIKPNVFHCNEGHAAMINVERLSDYVQHENLTFNEALEAVRASSLFTTHTPVPAGHDAFDQNLIRTYLRPVPERLKIDWDTFMNLGLAPDGKFSMSVLATRTSQEMNGVSMLHGEVTKDMFKYMWPGFSTNELYINYVTNGVHMPTWAAKEWRRLYESTFGDGFMQDQSNTKYWEKIFDVQDSVIWDLRNQLRKKLIDYVKARFEKSSIMRHESPKYVVETLSRLNEHTLTIGFARRFATYKRAHLLFSDIDRLAKIVNNPSCPVQFLFAGKAHPHDKAGQDLIKNIVEISRRPEFVGKILFLENYDMDLAKRLVRGVDVWLNNPTRPLEASGTSGQKAEMNGVLNFSVLDGWWVEGYKEKAGWALPQEQTYQNNQFQNELDAATIYSILENEIIPLFYQRNNFGIPTEWVQYIKRSIAGIAPHFTTKRMLDDYINKYYSPLYARSSKVIADNFKLARELSRWKNKIYENWDKVEVVSVDFPSTLKTEFKAGQNYHGEVIVDIKDLDINDIGVEMVIMDQNCTKLLECKELKLNKHVDSMAFFEIDFKLNHPGSYDYGVRLFAKNTELPHRQDVPLLRWV